MADFGTKPKVLAHTHKIPSRPERLYSKTAHSKLPPPIFPKPRQSSDVTPAVEYDGVLAVAQHQHSKNDRPAFKVTSRPYKSEEFAKSFTLPQIVRTSGDGDAYGNVGQSQFGKAEEVALLFSKTTKTVLACRDGEIKL